MHFAVSWQSIEQLPLHVMLQVLDLVHCTAQFPLQTKLQVSVPVHEQELPQSFTPPEDELLASVPPLLDPPPSPDVPPLDVVPLEPPLEDELALPSPIVQS